MNVRQRLAVRYISVARLSWRAHLCATRINFRLLIRLSTSKTRSSNHAPPYAQLRTQTPSISRLKLRDWSVQFEMAPRRSAPIPEEPKLPRLQFSEPLSWRAGKPIPTGELLRRLDTLSSELREMDQEDTDKDSLHPVAKELAGHNLINHKDKGVRAFTACCLVDVLKICAPDAPFTPSQLKVCQVSGWWWWRRVAS